MMKRGLILPKYQVHKSCETQAHLDVYLNLAQYQFLIGQCCVALSDIHCVCVEPYAVFFPFILH